MSAAAKALDALEAARPTAEKWTNEQRYVESCKQMLAVNLASPLAAVARAAMAVNRAWIALNDEDRPQYTGHSLDEFLSHEDPFVTAYHSALADMRAALDALEAAAAEGGGA